MQRLVIGWLARGATTRPSFANPGRPQVSAGSDRL